MQYYFLKVKTLPLFAYKNITFFICSENTDISDGYNKEIIEGVSYQKDSPKKHKLNIHKQMLIRFEQIINKYAIIV